MLEFFKCQAEEVGNAVKIGPYILIKAVGGKKLLKPKDEWSAHDKEMVRYNH